MLFFNTDIIKTSINHIKTFGKCDKQQQLKDILEAAMVSHPEGFADNSTIPPMTPTPVNKPSAWKSLCLFTNILDVKNKTAIHQVGASKSNHKSIQSVSISWALKPEQKVNSNINNQI